MAAGRLPDRNNPGPGNEDTVEDTVHHENLLLNIIN